MRLGGPARARDRSGLAAPEGDFSSDRGRNPIIGVDPLPGFGQNVLLNLVGDTAHLRASLTPVCTELRRRRSASIDRLPRWMRQCRCVRWAPNEHVENASARKRRPPEEPPALDPLENIARRLRPPANGGGRGISLRPLLSSR